MKTYKTIDGSYCTVGSVDACGYYTETKAAATYDIHNHITNSALRVKQSNEKQEVLLGDYKDWYWGEDFVAYVNLDSKF